METLASKYYTEKRWKNWFTRLGDKEINIDGEVAQILLNMRNDAVIAVANVLTDYDDGKLPNDVARTKLDEVAEIIAKPPDYEDQEKQFVVMTVQRSLRCVLCAAEQYVATENRGDVPPEEHVKAALVAQDEGRLGTAFMHCAKAGTRVIAGQEFDINLPSEAKVGPVGDWIDGICSLNSTIPLEATKLGSDVDHRSSQ